jgi:integrase
MEQGGYGCIMDLAYLTALRKSDILHLRLSDIKDNLLVVQTRRPSSPSTEL